MDGVLQARHATAADRADVAMLCRMANPGGDYVTDVWDSWLGDHGAYVVCKGDAIVGMFNLTIRSRQGWLEGTRVHASFRRRGIGTSILEFAQEQVRQAGGRIVRSFIETDNIASLDRAKKAGWASGKTWTWYRLRHAVRGRHDTVKGRKLSGMYADSWRVYDLDGTQDAVFFEGCAATVIPSRHYPDTVMVTVLEGGCLDGLAAHLGSLEYGAKKMSGWDSGVHVLSSLDGGLFAGHFEEVSSYHLMSRYVA